MVDLKYRGVQLYFPEHNYVGSTVREYRPGEARQVNAKRIQDDLSAFCFFPPMPRKSIEFCQNHKGPQIFLLLTKLETENEEDNKDEF